MTISKESEIDALKLYFGEPFVNENDTYNDIIINQPTIGDIIKKRFPVFCLCLLQLK